MAKINPAVKRTLLGSINDRDSNQIYKWLSDETLSVNELMESNINVATLNEIHTSNFPYLLKEAVENGELEIDGLKSYGLADDALAFIDGKIVTTNPENSEEIMRLLIAVAKEEKAAILMATHDMVLVEKFPGRILRVENTTVNEVNTPGSFDPMKASGV